MDYHAPVTAHRAPDIIYRSIPDLSVPIFDCRRLHASITVPTCASMWQEATARKSDRHTACRGCPVGAAHAGIDEPSTSSIAGTRICARCGNPTGRLILGHLCPSCYNRQREMIVGKNARGLPPVKLMKMRRLDPRRVTFLERGFLQVKRLALSASPIELIVATLRDARHTVIFGWHPAPALRQLRLF